MAYVALILLALEKWNSPWALTVVLLAETLPFILFGTLLGHMADKLSRKRIAIAADVLRAAAYIAMALVAPFWAFAALVFVTGIGEAAYQPASKAVIPELAPGKEDEAMGLLMTSYTVAQTGGPAIGAVLLLMMGAEWLILINGITFLVSALVLSTISFGGVQSHEQSTSIKESLAQARRVPFVPLMLGTSFGVVLVASFSNVGEPLLAQIVQAGPSGLAIMIAVFGAGGVLGAVRSSADPSKYLLGLVGIGLTFLALSAAPSFLVVLVLMFVSGMCSGFSFASDARVVSSLAPSDKRGIIFGAKDSIDSLALISSVLLSGLLADLLGVRILFAIGGGIALLFWLLSFNGFRAFKASRPSKS